LLGRGLTLAIFRSDQRIRIQSRYVFKANLAISSYTSDQQSTMSTHAALPKMSPALLYTPRARLELSCWRDTGSETGLSRKAVWYRVFNLIARCRAIRNRLQTSRSQATQDTAEEPTNPLENAISRMRALRARFQTPRPRRRKQPWKNRPLPQIPSLTYAHCGIVSNSTNPAKHDFNRHLVVLSGTQQFQLRLTALA
jgi:hypothetical protein